MATSLDLSRTYTSYSGVDIRVIVNGAQVGSMQALSYAIQREKAPIYVMGSVDPVSYSRGKRGIAGTMISLMMDSHILYTASFTGEQYYGDEDELQPVVNDIDSSAGLNNLNNENASGTGFVNPGINTGPVQLLGIQGFSEAGGSFSTSSIPGDGTTIRRDYAYNTSDMFQNYYARNVFYVDQILPFDITIVAANEYGQTAQMRLYGCEILNEGSGFSIDDIVIENQMTYVCRTILPWRTIANPEADQMYTNLLDPSVRMGKQEGYQVPD